MTRVSKENRVLSYVLCIFFLFRVLLTFSATASLMVMFKSRLKSAFKSPFTVIFMMIDRIDSPTILFDNDDDDNQTGIFQ